jgi:hypothetical protein
MPFTVNRRLVKNNCVLFFILFFILQFIHITFFKESYTYSTNIQFPKLILSKKINKTSFQYLQPFYHSVSCQNLFESDPDELKHALALLSDVQKLPFISDDQYHIAKEQCHIYRSERFNESFHREDTSINRQFPLAFNILMYENVEQFERLLRVIYRPQNYYCVHVDNDASVNVFEGVQSIVQCFNNVFLSNKREKVFYTTFSRLQADLNCMQDLIKYPSWKYLLNVANTELPLKTNSELVKILTIYRGYNDIEGRWKSRNIQRTEYVWEMINTTIDSHASPLRKSTEKKKSPPGNVEIVKGSAYGMFILFYLFKIHNVYF